MTELAPEIARRAAAVRLILLDCDGVLTDGCIVLLSDGEESRSFHVRDGFGIRMAQRAGIDFGIISGRASKSVATRAAELRIEEVHLAIGDKAARLDEILQRRKLAPEAVCFVGDDLNDLPVMRRVGLAAAPADAGPEAREAAHYVAERAGGRGAVREIIDLILRAGDRWDEATAGYRG